MLTDPTPVDASALLPLRGPRRRRDGGYGWCVQDPTNLAEAFTTFDATWEPRIVATVNDYDVRIARCEGDHTWHSHAATDEFFLCLDGQFTINLRDREPVVLRPGEVFTVPRGVEHFPQAAPGTRILMFEPRGTPSTGDEGAVDHLTTPTGVTID